MSDEKEKIIVCVYGTLKMHQSNHILLRGAKSLGVHEFKGTMYSLGMFPAVALEGEYKLRGELYEIDQGILTRLDGLEGYPDFYDRVLIPTKFGPAWVYVMEAEKLKDYKILNRGYW